MASANTLRKKAALAVQRLTISPLELLHPGVDTLPRPKPSGMTLFCFHALGGGASAFYRLASALAGVTAVAVQLPGRESRIAEKPYTCFERAAAETAEALSEWDDLPYAFFGHSMGALLAFRSAQILAKRYDAGPAHYSWADCGRRTGICTS